MLFFKTNNMMLGKGRHSSHGGPMGYSHGHRTNYVQFECVGKDRIVPPKLFF